MNLFFDTKIANKYTSLSQKMRVLTEYWVDNEIFCPSCGSSKIYNYENNRPVADFYCKKCSEDFELKSKKGKIGKTIPAGAYSKMIERINSSTKPNFFFMGYLESLYVNDFFVVPKHFFVSEIIEKRNPLKNTARRAGWIGSNILFSKIPKAGQIFYIEDGKEVSKKQVLEKWQKTIFLKKIKKADAKGWILDIMNCIDSLNKKEFTLQEIYIFEDDLRIIHTNNKHIKDKIRQQLQFLRNKKYLDFVGQGRYKLK
ncbi:MAG: restriction endonuclease [Patescibacteria group bacterium]|nr:restriction endonuclease [Patescibacteria group bacterium]